MKRTRLSDAHIEDAVLSTDLLGHVTYLIVAEKLTGWTSAEAVDRRLGRSLGTNARPEVGIGSLESAIKENKTVKLTPNCSYQKGQGRISN